MNNDQPPNPSSAIVHKGVWYVPYVPPDDAPPAISPVYAWLQRAAKCGITEISDAAYVLMAYYQGAEFPEEKR